MNSETDTTTDNPDEHPFAQYVRILGKGKLGSRSLTREEAFDAFTMIVKGEVEYVQLGAFLMLLRVKEETAEELAGFVEACRGEMLDPPPGLRADLDWSTYAGKRHQHPWYILAMLLLAEAGYRVLVHGAAGHTPGRLYTETAFKKLGLPIARDWSNVQAQLDKARLSYLPLEYLSPTLNILIQLRPLLGLRSPVNTLTRMLNPLDAPASVQSIFHPAYAPLHQATDLLLGRRNSLVLKGCSGEAEVKPGADTTLHLLREGQHEEIIAQRKFAERPTSVEVPLVAPLKALWRGESEEPYGHAATISTATAALLTLNPAWGWLRANEEALRLWATRDQSRLS